MRCQIAHCLLEATVDLVVSATGVVRVCEECHNPQALKWLRKKHRVGRYLNMREQDIWIPCRGDRPEPVEEALGVPSGGRAAAWAPYWIPCANCSRAIVFHWRTRRTYIRCPDCREAHTRSASHTTSGTQRGDAIPATDDTHSISAGQVTSDTQYSRAKDEIASFKWGGRPWGDGRPFWDRLNKRMRRAAQESWEERAAIMEYDGEMIRAEAEHRAYRLVRDKAAAAGLIKEDECSD